MATSAEESVCVGCGAVGADVAVRRSKGRQRLCGACFAAAVDARVRSTVARRFAHAARPWAQHTVVVAVSGSTRSLALLAALARAFPAAHDRAFRVQPVSVRCNTPNDPDDENDTETESMRRACAAVAVDAQPLVAVDAFPDAVLAAQWTTLAPDVRAVLWPAAVAAALARAQSVVCGRVLCVATAETADALAARCLALTACGRGGAAAVLAGPAATLGAVPLLRVLADLLDAEVAEYAAVRGVRGVRTAGTAVCVRRGADGARVLGVCRAFCADMQTRFDHTAFTVVRTAAKLAPPTPAAPRCALCGVPMLPQDQQEQEQERLCDACVRMRADADPDAAALLARFMQCVTAQLP